MKTIVYVCDLPSCAVQREARVAPVPADGITVREWRDRPILGGLAGTGKPEATLWFCSWARVAKYARSVEAGRITPP